MEQQQSNFRQADQIPTSFMPPTTMTALFLVPGIIGRMQGASSLIAAQQDNFDKTAAIPWEPGSIVGMFWSMMAPALLVLVVAAGALPASPGTVEQRRIVLRPGAQH